MTDDPADTLSASPVSAAHMLLARALQGGFTAGAAAPGNLAPGTRIGHELEVRGGRPEVMDHYVRLPDGTRHGVWRRALRRLSP